MQSGLISLIILIISFNVNINFCYWLEEQLLGIPFQDY